MAVVGDSTKLTSLQNERVKRAVRLRTGRSRNDPPLLFVEGFRQVRRAVENGVKPAELYFCPALYQGKNEPLLVSLVAAQGVDAVECTETVFRKLADRDRPDGVIALVPELRAKLASVSLPPDPLVLACERIERPGNLGALFRSADAAGASAVLVCDRCTLVNDPRTVRASVGTVFSLPVVEASSKEAIRWLKARGLRIVAASPDAKEDFTQADLSGPVAVVVGTEQHGLTGAWTSAADALVRIPMKGQADSLNVTSAAVLLLYEALRQRPTP
jgi:TrmH family RNA methyltransferase